MRIFSDVKILIATVVGLLLVAAAIGVMYVTLFDNKELRYKTQAKLRAAIPATAADELRARGHALRTGLSCQDLSGWTKKSMRVSCTGTTASKASVQVIGTGEEKTQEQYYTILLDGRPLVQNKGCLGADCRKKD